MGFWQLTVLIRNFVLPPKAHPEKLTLFSIRDTGAQGSGAFKVSDEFNRYK